MLIVPATLAVDAVETAELRLHGQQIHSQREPKATRMDGAKDYITIQSGHIICYLHFRTAELLGGHTCMT